MKSHSSEVHAISNVSFDMSSCGIEQNENDAAIISSLLFLMDSNVDHTSANHRSYSQTNNSDDEECVGHRLKYAQRGNVSIQDLWETLEVKSASTKDRLANSPKTINNHIFAETSSSTDRREDSSSIQKKESQLLVPTANCTGAKDQVFVHDVANDCTIKNGLKRSIQNITGTAHYFLLLI